MLDPGEAQKDQRREDVHELHQPDPRDKRDRRIQRLDSVVQEVPLHRQLTGQEVHLNIMIEACEVLDGEDLFKSAYINTK